MNGPAYRVGDVVQWKRAGKSVARITSTDVVIDGVTYIRAEYIKSVDSRDIGKTGVWTPEDLDRRTTLIQSAQDTAPTQFRPSDRVQPRPGTSDGEEGPGVVSGTSPSSWRDGDHMVHVRHDRGIVTSWDSSDLGLIQAAIDAGRVHDVAEAEALAYGEDVGVIRVGDRFMCDGMLVKVTVVDVAVDKIIFRAVRDQDAIDLGWFPTSYGAYEATATVADFRRMVDGAESDGVPGAGRAQAAAQRALDAQATSGGEPADDGEDDGVHRVSSQAGLASIRPAIVQLDQDDAAARALDALLEWATAADDVTVSIAGMVSRTDALRAAARDYRESIGGTA